MKTTMPNNRSAALFRASNILTLDYPFKEAIRSALGFVDEAIIVVDNNSVDDTPAAISYIAAKHRGQIFPVYQEMHFDRFWQERAWAAGADVTDCDWLVWLDLDELIHEDHHAELRAIMSNTDAHLINLKFVHLYGTPSWHMGDGQEPSRNTRIGRRSQGYKMVNRCTDKNPDHTCVFVEYQESQNAHFVTGDHIAKLNDVSILHYGWARDAQALAISRAKHAAWYADGDGLEDGRIPPVAPYDFEMAANTASGAIVAYEGVHPSQMRHWFASHKAEWEALDMEARGVLV